MKPPARRRVSLPPLAAFPPDPLMLDIRAAQQRGDELLTAALREMEQRQRLNAWLTVGLFTLAIGGGLCWYWLHPEWPADFLHSLFSSFTR